MAKTVFSVLKDKIDDQIQITSETLMAGTCVDFAKYKELCGVYTFTHAVRCHNQPLIICTAFPLKISDVFCFV